MRKSAGMLWSIGIFFCVVLFLIGCSGQRTEGARSGASGGFTLPAPTLSVEGNPVPYQVGSYTWIEGGRGVAVDTVDPPALVESLEPVVVRPNAVLTVSFADAPEEIHAGIWTDDLQPVSGGRLVLPPEEGDYVYLLVASWPQGSVSYAFPVRVSRTAD